MTKHLKFLLARIFGVKHERKLPVKDGVQTTLVGYLWRGVFYASDLRHDIVNPIAHKNALRQVLGVNKPASEAPRIFVPGGRR